MTTTPAEAAILSANRSFYAAFAKRDPGAMGRLWARKQPVVCIHPGWDAIHGREAVLSSFRAILGSAESPALRSSGEVVTMFDSFAMVTCIEHADGVRLVATNVFVFEEGAWRMCSHHASPTAGPRTPTLGPANTLN